MLTTLRKLEYLINDLYKPKENNIGIAIKGDKIINNNAELESGI